MPDDDSTVTIGVTLDITVDSAAYTDWHGELVADTMPARLTELIIGCGLFRRDKIKRAGGADVTLTGEEYALPLPDSPAWLTVRLTWRITLDSAAWSFYWGLPPHRSVAAHMASTIGHNDVVRHQYHGTVAVVPPPTLAEVISDEE